MKRLLTAITALFTLISALAAGVTVGAARTGLYKPLLEGRRVALLSNHTGMIDSVTHTADLMMAEGINLTLLLSPEHGFRGTADAGETVASGRDAATGLKVVSMFDGRRHGVSLQTLAEFDVAVVDLQDVGARFYTYYITMLQLMRDCAAAGKQVIVLDRPNPLGMTVDGPLLERSLYSGVGKLPVPVIHGMTMGELALMANGEGWVPGGHRVKDLKIIPCEGYTHQTRYTLSVAPSPNLKTQQAILLYPSTCLFEGTIMSVGRGTDNPFTLYGHPSYKGGPEGLPEGSRGVTFTPESRPGAKNPPLKRRECRGAEMSGVSPDTIIARGFDLSYLIDAYRHMPRGERFFTTFIDKLAGTPELRRQIESGMSVDEIRATWQDDLDAFRRVRAKYLLYPDTSTEK